MTKSLDVLLIESEPGDGARQAASLAAAGHRVHGCFTIAGAHKHGEPGRVALRDRYLCDGVTTGLCPIEAGVDVALLVRGRPTSEPTVAEAGASCALRAGIPLVEDGPQLLDPFAPWLTTRAGDDVVAACEAAVDRGFDPLRAEIRRRISHVLSAAGVDPNEVDVSLQFTQPHLTVRLRGPAISAAAEQAVGVRVLDALRTSRRSFGQVGVSYETTP